MVRQPPVRRLLTDPEKIADLLDRLRHAGYKVSVDQYVMVQDLVLALLARGEDIGQPDRLKAMLGPVVCTTAREQDTFGAEFDRWSAGESRNAPEYGAPPRTTGLWHEIHEITGLMNVWQTWLVTFGVASLILVWLYFSFGSQSRTLAPAALPVQLHDLRVPGGLAALLAFGWLLKTLWWRYRTALFLRRQVTKHTPELIDIAVYAEPVAIMSGDWAERTARDFRRRYREPSGELAIDRTVEQTAGRLGRFSPVFVERLVMPDYLVLIDRKTHRDHHARYVYELMDGLAHRHVSLSIFYFDGDPRTVVPAETHGPSYGRARRLQYLSQKFENHRLLIFTDGIGLFNPVTGRLEPWVDAFRDWPHRTLFTPGPRESWGAQESLLAEMFDILPDTSDGLKAYAQTLSGRRVRFTGAPSGAGPFPPELRANPQRWLDHLPPEPDLVEDLLSALRRYLGERGFYWLSCCAVYPDLDFSLTVYLGRKVRALDDTPLYSTDCLRALSRLPWFRTGHMPDWLRNLLIERLTVAQNAEVRDALNRLLVTACAGRPQAFELKVARQDRITLNRLAPAMFRRLAHEAPEGSPYRDFVFATTMRRRSKQPLAVSVPEGLSRLLRPKRFLPHRVPVWVIVAAALAMIFLIVIKALPGPPRFTGDGFGPMLAFAARYGYVTLFCFVLFEGIGLPIPAVPMLLAAGALSGLGRLSFSVSLAVTVAACLIPDLVWYSLGRTRGHKIVSFLCRISLEPDTCVRNTQNTFERWGFVALFFAKFIPGLGSSASPMAGVIRMPVARFLGATAAGAAIWGGIYLLVGYLLRDQLERVSEIASRMGSWLTAVVAGLITLYVGMKFYQRRSFIQSLRVGRITPDELMRKIENREDLAIIDLRHNFEIEMDGATLPHAIRIEPSELDRRFGEIPRNKEIVIYCT